MNLQLTIKAYQTVTSLSYLRILIGADSPQQACSLVCATLEIATRDRDLAACARAAMSL